MEKKVGVIIEANSKELDRLAIGARLYDMLDLDNMLNSVTKSGDGTGTISEETIRKMINMVNPKLEKIKQLKEKMK